MCILIFSTTLIGNISYSEENSAKLYHNVHRSSCEVPVILVILSWQLHFLNIFSSKNAVIKFNQNPFSGSGFVPCGRTDRHDETNSRFPQFCERTLKT